MVLNILSFIVTTMGVVATVWIFNMSVNNTRKKTLFDIIDKLQKVFNVFNSLIPDDDKLPIINEHQVLIEQIYNGIMSIDYRNEYGLHAISHSEKQSDGVGHRVYKMKKFLDELNKDLEAANIYGTYLLFEYWYGTSYFLQHYNIEWSFIRDHKKLWTIVGIKATFVQKQDSFKYGKNDIIVPERISTMEEFRGYIDYMNRIGFGLNGRVEQDFIKDVEISYDLKTNKQIKKTK